MSDVERRIDLTFAFIADAIKNPQLLDIIPDDALVAFGDDDNPELTRESAALLHEVKNDPKFSEDQGRRGVLVVRRKKRALASSSQTPYRLVESH